MREVSCRSWPCPGFFQGDKTVLLRGACKKAPQKYSDVVSYRVGKLEDPFIYLF